MSFARQQLAIAGAALVVGVAVWVGGYAIRYGGLKPGLAMLLADSPLLSPLASRIRTGLPPGVEPLQPGDRLANVTLDDLDGTPRPLSEWSGKRLVINFWATWCLPCRKEMPLFAELARATESSDLQVIAIGLDDPAKIREWIGAHPLPFPVLLGQPLGYDVSVQFGNRHRAVPYSVLVGRDGRLERRHLGSFHSLDELRAWIRG